MAADSLVELDDFGSLVDLAVQRILVSDEVAATKFRSGAPVEDLLRERQVLAEAGRRAVQLGLDRELAIRFVRRQIYASKIVQSGLLARWQAHPEQAPSTTPDLQSIRERLDQLDEQLLEQLRCTRAIHRLASLCRRLREVRIPVGRRAPSRRTAPPRAPPRDRVALLGRVSRQRLPSRGRGEGAGRTCGRRAKGRRFLSRPAPSHLRFFSSHLGFFSSRSVGKKRHDPRDESADHGSGHVAPELFGTARRATDPRRPTPRTSRASRPHSAGSLRSACGGRRAAPG
jgi:chorismate mutase-like protein